MPPAAHKIQIPRWMQLVGLPLALLFLWTLASTVAHVVFLFIVAALIALLLDPLVRALGRMRTRGFSVAVVFLSFATVLVVGVIAIGVVVVDQSREAADRIDAYLTVERGQSSQTDAERDVDRLQAWLNDHGLERVKVEEQGQDFVDSLRDADPQEYTSRVIDFLEGRRFDLRGALLPRAHHRRVGLHAARHGEAVGRGRPAVPAAAGLRLADPPDRERSPATCAARCSSP